MQTSASALRCAIFVALGGFVFGYDASVIAGVVGFVSREFGLNEFQEGLVVSAPTLATIFALTVSPLADIFGRKKVLQLLAALFVISAIYSAFAPDYVSLVVARAIGGYAFGCLMLAPIYIAEIAPPERRGLMVSVNQFNIVLGLSAAYFVNYYILQWSTLDASWVSALYLDTHTWRVMLLIEALPALVWFLLLMTVPESPRWLVMKNRIEDAKQTLARLVSASKIEDSIASIRESLSSDGRSMMDNIRGLFARKMTFILLIGVLLAVIQQATGINAIFFYAPTIFEQSGVGTNAAFEQAVWVGFINVVFTIVAMLLIDRVGRKPLLVVGLIGVALSLLTTAYGFKQATFQLTQQDVVELTADYKLDGLAPLADKSFDHDVTFKEAVKATMTEAQFKDVSSDIMNRAININATLVLVGVLGFVASFAISLGPVMWVMLSEIFPNSLRAVAMAFTGLFNSGTSFLVQLLFPMGLSSFGAAAMFGIYGSFAVFGLILVVKYLPETKGRSLEELEAELVNNRG